MYYRVGHDWDGFRALAAAQPQARLALPAGQLVTRLPLVRPMIARSAIPAGSIVPTIRARQPAKFQRVTPTDSALLRMLQDRVIRRSVAVRAMPVKQATAYAQTFRGFIPPGMAFGQLGDETTEGLTEAIREATAQLAAATEEIRATISEDLQQQLGGMMLAQRAGDFSASLGFDVVMQDLTQNCSGEMARIQRAGLLLPDTVMQMQNFSHIASVFKDQGWSVSSLKTFARDAAIGYERITEDFLNLATGDSAAYGEGGLRRMVEEAISDVSAQMPEWLTGENLERVGNAAQAWVGAASSGKTSQYVTAAGATIAAAGAIIPQPAGIIVSAVGGLISLIGSLLGGDPEQPPPELTACTGESGSYDHPWAYNPEAWAALAFCIVAKEGFQDSPTYKEAAVRRAGRDYPLVQEVITEAKWWCTIDRYSGEVMVQEPPEGGRQKPLRRLMDVFDIRKILEDYGLEQAVSAFHEMAGAFGCAPRSGRWGPPDNPGNFLYCYPNGKETFTRFVGTGSLHANTHVAALRHNWSGGKQAPENLSVYGSSCDPGQSSCTLLQENFWETYRAGLVTSIYLGGTVPYGIVQGSMNRVGVVTGVGVGGARIPLVRGAERAGNIGYVIFSHSGVAEVNTSLLTDPAYKRPHLDSLLLPNNGAEWALANRIAMPSPDVQIDPGDAVHRPSNQHCGPPLPDGRRMCVLLPSMTLQSLAFLRKTDKAGAVGNAATGMSTGAKIALGAAALALVGGGGYYLWSKSKERG